MRNWLPPSAYALSEFPVPCPECGSETFDTRYPGSFICSDCGWKPRFRNIGPYA